MLSKELLLEIREKYEHYGDTDKLKPNTCVKDVRLLLEEIDRLDTFIQKVVDILD